MTYLPNAFTVFRGKMRQILRTLVQRVEDAILCQCLSSPNSKNFSTWIRMTVQHMESQDDQIHPASGILKREETWWIYEKSVRESVRESSRLQNKMQPPSAKRVPEGLHSHISRASTLPRLQ